MRVLIADDQETICILIATVLKSIEGVQTEIAEDGVVAWDKLTSRGKHFDLLISDWNMPRMDGLTLLKTIRADPRLKTLPVILLTAEDDKSHVMAAIKHGVSGYVVKPFTPLGLLEKLQRFLPRKG